MGFNLQQCIQLVNGLCECYKAEFICCLSQLWWEAQILTLDQRLFLL